MGLATSTSSLSSRVCIPSGPKDLQFCLPSQRISNQTFSSQGQVIFSPAFLSCLQGLGFLKGDLSSKVWGEEGIHSALSVASVTRLPTWFHQHPHIFPNLSFAADALVDALLVPSISLHRSSSNRPCFSLLHPCITCQYSYIPPICLLFFPYP